jgi:hypothetical protein
MKEIGLPNKTILLGEVCCVAEGGKHVDEFGMDVDDLDLVNGVRGGLTETALETQREHGCLGFCVWDIAYWNNECLLLSTPAKDRFMKIRDEVFDHSTAWVTYPEIAYWEEDEGHIKMLSPVGDFHFEVQSGSVEKTLVDLAKDQQWEGWVVVDPDSIYGEKGHNWRGKPERPKFCAKLKPKYEADFVVRWDPDNGIGKRGKGKKSKGIGSVQGYLYHPELGEIPVSLIGGGLDDEQVVKYANPKLYPMVWQVEFASWTKDGSLQFPVLLRDRDDKPLEECTVDQNPNWEQHYSNQG